MGYLGYLCTFLRLELQLAFCSMWAIYKCMVFLVGQRTVTGMCLVPGGACMFLLQNLPGNGIVVWIHCTLASICSSLCSAMGSSFEPNPFFCHSWRALQHVTPLVIVAIIAVDSLKTVSYSHACFMLRGAKECCAACTCLGGTSQCFCLRVQNNTSCLEEE